MSDLAATFNWTDPSIWSAGTFAQLAGPGDQRWATLEPGPRVLVAAHDAGCAEMVGAWLKRRLALSRGEAAPLDPALHVAGPARKVFERLGLMGLPTTAPSGPFQPDRVFDWVLCGTGWSTRHELTVMQEALARHVPVSAYLDHWTNYPNRFSTGSERVRPTYLWVGDVWAQNLALAHFGGASEILLMPSAYFAAIRGDYERNPRRPEFPAARYLYVTEPTSASAKAQFGDERWYGYTELEALERFLDFVRGLAGERKVRLRPHPGESPGKYDALVSRYPFVEMSPPGNVLLDDCTWADVVVGCNTMAMVIGWLCGREIFCSIPPAGPECDLPLPAIRRLFPRT